MNLILDATTKSITAVMSGAAATTNPDFTSAYADNTGATFTEGANDGAFNGTTPVTLVAAPGALTRRTVKSITIENKDTAAVTITVNYVNGANTRVVAKVTLQVGDTWTFTGTFDTNGNLKSTIGGGTMAQQNANAVVITGGTIDNVTYTNSNISGTTGSTATFATSSLPLVPEGYITIKINGTAKKIPYYGV